MNEKLIEDYIKNPIPIWNESLVAMLTEAKWDDLYKSAIVTSPDEYTTAKSYLSSDSNFGITSKHHVVTRNLHSVYLEDPNNAKMADFYEEHGLRIDNTKDRRKQVARLQKAFAILELNQSCFNVVLELVKCIQILQQEDPDCDVSYSHPSIPFTIFVSVNNNDNPIEFVRVAEGILHEAMHLFLTLLENKKAMIVKETTEVFYSPWRETQRPVQGVLHGLFVFRVIQGFYRSILSYLPPDVADFASWRIEQITGELQYLSDFPYNIGLTSDGRKIAKNLLSY